MSDNKKNPLDIDSEELLKQLELEDEVKHEVFIDEETNNVLNFLIKYNIKPGDEIVSATLLYKLYKAQSKDPVQKQSFSITLGQYLHSYSNKKGKFYMIDQDSFKITETLLKLITKKKTNMLSNGAHQVHFERFLKELDIKPGRVWFQGYFIHEIYRHYCIDRGIHKNLGYDTFIRFLKLHFEHRRITQNRSLWFRVNEETTRILTQEQKDGTEEKRRNPKKANWWKKKRKKSLSSIGANLKSKK